jgi:hypothetical protein
MFAALRRPLVALILGFVPFLLFAGLSNSLTVNGALVRDDRFNVLGIVLAIAGLALAATSLRSPGAFGALRKAIAIAALLVCCIQFAASAGLISPGQFISSLMPGSDLPPLKYNGLDALNRRIPEGILAKNDPEATRRTIVNYKVSVISDAHIHMAYADRCHDGRYRIDIKAVQSLPDFLTADDRKELERRIGDAGKLRPEPCSKNRTNYAMGELVDGIRRVSDIVQILVDGYSAQVVTSKRQ